MKKYLLILSALLLTAVGASAQITSGGTYMLQNVETGYYLGSGCTWGTQASLIKQPQQFTLTETGGTYTLESYVYNGENSNKLGTNLYVDGSDAALWTIEKQSNGAYTLYNATVGYLAGNGKDEPVVGVTSITSATYWNLITKDDIVASQANATSASPVDVTGLINNPSLNKNSQTTYGTAYWSTTGTVNIGYTNAGGDTKSYGNVAEGYHVGFSMYQTLSNLTPGIYVLSAQGFHRDDDSQASYTAPVMYVGSELTSGIPSMTSANGVCTQKGSSGQTMADAQTDFLSNLYPISPIQFTVDEGNTSVELGFKGTDTYEWVIWGDLELLYYGTEPPVLPAHECVAEFGHWSISDNTGGSFQRNTWSTEADPSGMVTPFIEYWVGSGNQLSDATISHTSLTDLTAGYYEVSIFARAFNENSLVDVAEGITFTANEESIDLNKETHATYNHVSAEEYGTYKVYCQVTDDGTLDINFTLKEANCDWLAFKNLDVVYMGSLLTDLPTLEAATGTMNLTIASAQTTALGAYASEATLDNYNAAYQAVECARVSAEFYAGIAEALSELEDYLDDAGKAWLEANDVIKAYEEQTLAYQDMYGVYMGAVKQQTTIGIDLTEAMEGTGAWTAAQGNGPSSYSSGFATETYIDGANATTGNVLYYTVTGLSSDVYYTVSFYVAANLANSADGTSGDDISQAYANGKTIDITVGTNSAAQISSLSDMTLVSINCTADENGVLEFGIKNVAAGGNWFLCAPASLAIAGSVEAVADDSDYAVGDEATVDGTIYSIVGENLFKNGGFNNGVLDWTAGSGYTNDLSILNVTYSTEGGYNGGAYITLKSSVGAANAATPTQAIAVEAGKTYLFVGYTSGTAPTDANKRYSALFEMADATDEANHEESGTSYSNTIIQLEWGNAGEGLNGWTKTEGVFTVPTENDESTYGTYSYVGMRMNWSTGSYDGFQLYEVKEVETIEWKMTDAGWGTLILPFAASIPEADNSGNAITWTAYSCAGLESDGETLSLTSAETLVANTPYILSGTPGTYTFKGTPVEATNGLTSGMLTGTFVNMTYDDLFALSGTVYLLQNHDDGGVAFYPVVEDLSSAATLTPYHCYLTDSRGKGVRGFISFPNTDGEATAIVAVESEEAEGNDAIYDLSGRKVSKAVKGVYIQNGKKVLVK